MRTEKNKQRRERSGAEIAFLAVGILCAVAIISFIIALLVLDVIPAKYIIPLAALLLISGALVTKPLLFYKAEHKKQEFSE